MTLALMMISIVAGLLIGLYYLSWKVLLSSTVIIAAVSALGLQRETASAYVGIAIIFFLLTIHQIAYIVGTNLKSR